VANTLLTTKLIIPQLRAELVPRPRLIEKLNEGLDGRLTIISAPAGFGKTTLAAAWIKQLPASGYPWGLKDCAWISLDGNDNETSRFMRYLIAAVQTIFPNFGNEQLDILENSSKPVFETITQELLNQIAVNDRPLLIAFDDYHEIQNEDTHQVLQTIVDYLPPKAHLLITTRENPSLPLPRWRSRNWLNEITSNDLRFNGAESASFFHHTMQLDLSTEAVALLEERTEGWVAGLQLAALSLAETGYSSRSIEGYGGKDRFVAEYLLTEVLERQTTEVRNFLLGTSVLERFNSELCAAVLRADASDEKVELTQKYQSLISDLERANLFIIPLDRERYWYRYHHMFAQLLRQHLEQIWPKDKVHELYSRAAHWCMEHGFMEEAAGYSLRGEDYVFAAHLITNIEVDGLWNQSLGLQLRQWGRALPSDVLQEYPIAAVHIAGAHMTRNEVKEAIHYVELVRDDPRVKAEIMLVDSIFVRNTGDVQKAHTLAIQASELFRPYNPTFHIVAQNQVIVCLMTLGELVAAEELAEKVRNEFRYRSEKILNVYIQIVHILGIIKLLRGKLFDAECVFMEGIETIEHSGTSLPLIGLLQAQLGAVNYEWNEIGKAAEYCKAGLAWGERTGVADIITQALSVQADLAILDQDKAAVQVILQKLLTIMDWPDFSDMGSNVQAGQALYNLRLGDLAAALQWANDSGYSLDDVPPLTSRNRYLVYARIRYEEIHQSGAKDQVYQIINFVDRLIDLGTRHDLKAFLIDSWILKALLLDLQDQTKEAVTALDNALELALPGKYIRTFLDLGLPLRDLLQASLTSGSHTDYKRSLLSAFSSEGANLSNSTSSNDEVSISLTSRENEVLQLIAAGLSNKAIQENLTLSGNTVRSHIKSLYSKLGVHSRTQAIKQAKEYKLL